MAAKLRSALDAKDVSVVDQSGGCGAQYRVDVCSEQFRGLSTVKQHKLVTSLLKEEVANMHAIRIFTSVPE